MISLAKCHCCNGNNLGLVTDTANSRIGLRCLTPNCRSELWMLEKDIPGLSTEEWASGHQTDFRLLLPLFNYWNSLSELAPPQLLHDLNIA